MFALFTSNKKKSKKKNKKAFNNVQPFINTVNDEQGQKHRVIVTQILCMTLSRETETELLWFVAQGFDLPLVIGEQFICKTRKFQSASYHACLEFTLTALFHERFAQDIWLALLAKLHDSEICHISMNFVERKTRVYYLKKYDNCFIGKEAVDFLVNYKFVESREKGIALGEKWDQMGLLQHVTRGNAFKDEQLFYTFDEEEIIDKIKLVQVSRRRSRDTVHRYSNYSSIERADTNLSIAPMMSNSEINIKKQKGNKKTKRSKKQKKGKKNKSNKDMMSKDTIYGNNNGFYGGSANTLIDDDSKVMEYMNTEWSDSVKEHGDIFSDYSDKLHSPNPSSRPQSQRHRKKHSLSLPWFGNSGNSNHRTPV